MPRLVIFAIDLAIVIMSFIIANALRFNFDPEFISLFPLSKQLPFLLGINAIWFLLFQSFSGFIRHTSVKDLENIIRLNFYALATCLVLNLLINNIGQKPELSIPTSVLIIHFLLVSLLMSGFRLLYKSLHHKFLKMNIERRSIIIYGAGRSGILVKRTLEQDDTFNYQIAAFIDDNPSKAGKTLEGIPVIGRQQVNNSFIKKHNTTDLIIAIQKISRSSKRHIINHFIEMNLMVKHITTNTKWLNYELSSRLIKNIHIEDLLERDEIRLDHTEVQIQVKDQVALVTGAAGSIGSEIIRQLLHYSPSKVILIDQAESDLHELILELEHRYKALSKGRIISYVCDICNLERTEHIFKSHQPNIVYHAAAYKHVPLMEDNPSEAIRVNVLGTKNVADMAIRYGSDSFVLISTDKAVNPTNIMGASKRIAEMYVQSRQLATHTKFITTRFGNVLGSNGSVIPLFRKQIEQGGPITITHEKITRYFMTIPEACELVLEAGAMGKGGEIFVFDMGRPIKVLDLARKMIRLSGYQQDEIEIKTIGLRPGEKLFEELISREENYIKTHHRKINIARVRDTSPLKMDTDLKCLAEILLSQDDKALVSQMKRMVPEYISKRSVFESLDNTIPKEQPLKDKELV